MANENLQNALEQTGLTIEAFAEVIKVDPKSVGRWVNGNTIPYPKHRKAISHALNIPERDLWPQHTPAPERDPGAGMEGGGCDVLGSWAYADDLTAPDLVAFIAGSEGPIDVLDSYCGIQLGSQAAEALAAQAAAGHPVRVLAGTLSEELGVLVGQPGAQVRADQIWVEFWFLRAGERMLFAINFQDDVTVYPPPLLELTATITGGLFGRARNKFEELWQLAADDPQTLLATRAQLDQLLTHAGSRETEPADRQRPGRDSSATPVTSTRTQATSPSAQSESFASQQRRWPGRPD